MMLHLISAATFKPLVGEPFSLKIGDDLIRAELTDAIEYSETSMPGTARTAFSLFFSVQTDDFPNTQSGHYVIEGESLQPVGPLYMERIISRHPGIIRLEAAFN